jgi:hypothetical protein
MLTDDERATLIEAAKLLALDGMLDAAAGAPSLRAALAAKLRAITAPRVATVGELSNHHPDGCHTTNVAARLDCTSDGHHECVSCARFDAAGRAARGDEPIGNHATRGPIGEG